MNFSNYILHPEQLNRESLYELRSYVALYPYNQVARLLLLKNLFLLHDSSFDEELRRAAFYITDRTVLFDLVEGNKTEIRKNLEIRKTETPVPSEDRTASLIDDFLASVPEEQSAPEMRKPSVIDATSDYAAYLLSLEEMKLEGSAGHGKNPTDSGHLIDEFLDSGGKITLPDEDETNYTPHESVELENDKDSLKEDYYTETLAKIYIKQGKYLEALEIFKHINLVNPKKSVYFADQMRFLEKIIAITNK